MKWLLGLNILFSLWSFITGISKSNELLKKAEKNLTEQNYEAAIHAYTLIIHQYNNKGENVRMNLANAYFLSDKLNSASIEYKELSKSKNPAIRSEAFLQLGAIAFKYKKYEKALSLFKSALTNNPNNKAAAVNYEIVKSLIDESEDVANSNANTNQKQQQSSGSTNNNNNSVNKSKKNTSSNLSQSGFQANTTGKDEADILNTRFHQINISKSQALSILETMKNSEIQYLQQRTINVERKNNQRPDW